MTFDKMTTSEYNKTIKDLKTVRKFTRISRTMVKNIKNRINDENKESPTCTVLCEATDYIESVCAKIDKSIEDFKTEQRAPGCQLSIFDTYVE